MKTLSRCLVRLRNFVTGRRGDQRLREELEDYVAREAEANIQAGMSEEEARRPARLKLGSAEAIREQYHAEEGLPLLEYLAQDIRFSLRQMRRSLGFTLVVVLTMALGIAATTTMFTVVYSTLLRSLPYPQSERIAAIHDTRITGRSAGGLMAGPRFYDIEARNRSFSSLAIFYFDESTLIAGKKLPVYVKGAGANAGFWDVFATAPMLGRVFDARDDAPHAPQTVVLSYPGWQRLFGGDPNVIGEQVKLGQQTATIVGVMPRGFSASGDVELWHAAQFTPNSWGNDRGDDQRDTNVFGRLRLGVTLAQAQADLDRIGEQLGREYPSSDGAWRFTSETLREDLYGDVQPALVALLIASALLLLIACINVANLLLSRATTRRREVALRRALGASGVRVAFQFFVESVLLALAGGGTGILLAYVLTRIAATSLPGILGQPGTIHMDGIVTGVALLISVATGIVFGVVPVLETRKVQLHSALKQGDTRLGGAAGNWLRSVLVGVQVGLSLVLLVGASLLADSLWNLMKQPLGFEPEHLLTVRVVLPWDTRPEAVRNFYDDVQQRIENLPGVEAAGQISSPPMTDFHVRGNFNADWLPQVANQPAISAESRNIAGNLLAAIGTPLLAGRDFSAADQVSTVPPFLVNEALVREYLPKGDPIGHHLFLDGQAHEIVGVVADVRGVSGTIGAEPGPAVYWPANAHGGWHRYFLVRTKVPPEQLAQSIREQVYQSDPQQSVGEIGTMDQLLGDAVAQPRLNAAIVASFAAVALLLACIGIYGVVSYLAAQRTQEIGVRMALGATRGDITRLFVRRAMIPAAIGLATGAVVSLAANRLLRSQLYGVQPDDLRLYLASVLVLLAPLLVAILRPAIRAGKTEPMEALRAE
jgi:putative ABC transport system permease protein